VAFKVPVVQSKCGCCPSCEASAASLRDVVVGADIFIGAAEAVMDRVAGEVRNARYKLSSVSSPRSRVVAHTVLSLAPLLINTHTPRGPDDARAD